MPDKGLPQLPPGMLPRGLTRAQAAAYCGCETIAAFDEWVRKEIVPKAMLGTSRWDRKAIDRALDRRSGLIGETGANESFDEWLSVQPLPLGESPPLEAQHGQHQSDSERGKRSPD